MTTFLLTWNPTIFLWDDYADMQLEVELGFDSTITWSCGVRKNLPMGSRVFLIRLGYQQPIHGILASGYTIGEPFTDDHWNDGALKSTAQYVEFRPDVMLNPEIHALLNPDTEVSKNFTWHSQSSGIEIPEAIAQLLEDRWSEHLAKLGIAAVSSKAVLNERLIFMEGASARITVNRYERDPKARQACIDNYGISCSICGFDFETFYGSIGTNFIHVHHLNPVALQTSVYQLDPIKDLRPVCPNCHAMLHRESPPLSIEALRLQIAHTQDT